MFDTPAEQKLETSRDHNRSKSQSELALCLTHHTVEPYSDGTHLKALLTFIHLFLHHDSWFSIRSQDSSVCVSVLDLEVNGKEFWIALVIHIFWRIWIFYWLMKFSLHTNWFGFQISPRDLVCKPRGLLCVCRLSASHTHTSVHKQEDKACSESYTLTVSSSSETLYNNVH